MVFIDSKTAEEKAVMDAAYAVCAAVKTAPKAHGINHLDTAILTGEDKDKLAAEMRKISELPDGAFFARDAGNVDKSAAVVLVGAKETTRGLMERCQLCHYENCTACNAANGCCVFTALDLGIALGAAAAMLSDVHIDNRIMFTIGKAAAALGLLGEHKLIMGIPMSVSGKSPFFDRQVSR